MLYVEREAEILSFVNKNGVATVRELAELCGVTEVTIRRDLTRLESLQLVERTHGGVISVENPAIPIQTVKIPGVICCSYSVMIAGKKWKIVARIIVRKSLTCRRKNKKSSEKETIPA